MAPHAGALRAILVALGVTTALLGAVMCVLQRHIKRLLAFSTIGHVGMFVCGIGLLGAKALAGVAVFIVGHGLTKAALFMICGILLHRFGTVDEYDLHGRGRECGWPECCSWRAGSCCAAPPPFTEFQGKSLIESAASEAGYGWLVAVFAVVSALTGGAVLRVAGRVFCGWGPSQGPDPRQARAAHERVDETREDRDHTPPLMLIVPGVLLAATVVVGLVPGASRGRRRSAARFADHPAYAAWVLHGRSVRWPAPPATPRGGARRGHRRCYAGGGVRGGRAPGSSAGRCCAACPPASRDRRPRGGAWPAGAAFRPHRRLHRLVDDRRRPARRSLPAGAALTGRTGPVGAQTAGPLPVFGRPRLGQTQPAMPTRAQVLELLDAGTPIKLWGGHCASRRDRRS